MRAATTAGSETARLTTRDAVAAAVEQAVESRPITDVHTHLYPPAFGSLLLWGLDDLLTYHYLTAEVLRADPGLQPQALFALSKAEQADLIWQRLFLEASPVSEACRGPLTTLQLLGIEPGRDLTAVRRALAERTVEEHVEAVFCAAHVRTAVMTNDPFDEQERELWLAGPEPDPRFLPALRLDGLLVTWGQAVGRLRRWGYEVTLGMNADTCREVRRFLTDWIERLRPVYMAVSLPQTFTFPDETSCGRLIAECVLPLAAERHIPFALMIGVKRAVNPGLLLAGDGVGRSDLGALERLCAAHPGVRFLATALSRENQHELCVAARKFANLLPFGCWWFLNNPSLIEEITRMRLELLGLSFIPQHSDARILDQLVYKWAHSREILVRVLTDKYDDLRRTGWSVTAQDVGRDVERLLAGNFAAFAGGPGQSARA